MINNSIFYNNACDVTKHLHLYCKKLKMCGYAGYWCNLITKSDILYSIDFITPTCTWFLLQHLQTKLLSLLWNALQLAPTWPHLLRHSAKKDNKRVNSKKLVVHSTIDLNFKHVIHSLSDRLITRPPIIVFHFHLQRWQFTAIHFMTLLRCVNTCAARSSSIFLNIIFDPLYCSTFLAIVVHFKSIIVSCLFYHIDLIHFFSLLKVEDSETGRSTVPFLIGIKLYCRPIRDLIFFIPNMIPHETSWTSSNRGKISEDL